MARSEVAPSTPSPSWVRATLGIWVFGFAAYFIPAATWSPVSRFLVTRQIVEQQGISIDRFADATGDRARVNGHWLSDKAPLPSLAAVVPYAPVRLYDRARGLQPEYIATSDARGPAIRVSVNQSFRSGLYTCSLFTAGLSLSLLAMLLFELLRSRFSEPQALLGSVITVLGTPLFPYATSFYGHTIAAALLVAGLYCLSPEPDPGVTSSPRRLRVAGACLAAAVGCEYIVALPVLVVVLFALAAGPSEQRLLRLRDLALGAALPIAVVSAYHWAAFGAPWRTGYSFIAKSEFAAGHATGLLGVNLPRPTVMLELLFGRRRGLFYVAPASALALFMCLKLARADRDFALRAGLAAGLTLLLANAGYYMWWGGAAAAPRHLIPALGVLGFGAAALISMRRLRWLFLPVAALSILNMLVIAAVGVEAPEHGDVLFDFAYRRLWEGKIAGLSGASNFGIGLGLPRAATLGPPLVWLIVGGHWLWRMVEPPQALAKTAL